MLNVDCYLSTTLVHRLWTRKFMSNVKFKVSLSFLKICNEATEKNDHDKLCKGIQPAGFHSCTDKQLADITEGDMYELQNGSGRMGALQSSVCPFFTYVCPRFT